RGIAGASMGGYGALYLAFHHPDLFSAAASQSGVASLLYDGPYPYKKNKAKLSKKPKKKVKDYGSPIGEHLSRMLGLDATNWRAHDPTSMVAGLDKSQKLVIYLDCGTEDEYKLQHGNAYLDELLTAAGVEHTLYLVP